jgi:hypothetical protein
MLSFDAGEETSMFELNEQQRQELSAPEPIAIDPQTRETYVLVRRETYDRWKSLLALDDYDPDEGAGHINGVMAEDDAKDPYLERYQNYGKQA